MVRILKDVRLLERLQKLKTSLLSNVKKNQQTISFIDSITCENEPFFLYLLYVSSDAPSKLTITFPLEKFTIL